MIDSTIAYKSIIMRCDRIDKSAYAEPDSGVEIEFYKQGMETVWAEVQKGAGEFADCSEEEIVSYFTKRFGTTQQELERRCIFLKEKKTGTYIGTCIAWFEPKGEEIVPVLHWLAVNEYTEAMAILEKYMTDESYKNLLQTSVL